MRILIVGGAGEVGKNLTSFLARRDHEVSILDRAAVLPEVLQALPVKYISGDITDPTSVNAAVKGTEAIIHLAWSFADDAPTIFNEDIRLIASDQWKGPAFLNEVWNLSLEKAGRELGYAPQASTEEMQVQLSNALQSGVNQVRKEARQTVRQKQ